MTREEVFEEVKQGEDELKNAVRLYEVEKYREEVIMQLRSVNELIDHICKDRDVAKSSLLNNSRRKQLNDTRHMIWYLIHKKAVFNHLTYMDMGKMFKRDHSTAIHAVKRIETQIEFDGFMRDDIMRYANAFGCHSSWDPVSRRLKFSKPYILETEPTTT